VAVILKASPKRTHEALKVVPRVPFEEFPMGKVDELVDQLEREKPKDSKVEVSQMDESRHSPCMQEMEAIMVHNLEEGSDAPQIFAIYQFCASCKVGVRVL
jgi:hypothetical protein